MNIKRFIQNYIKRKQDILFISKSLHNYFLKEIRSHSVYNLSQFERIIQSHCLEVYATDFNITNKEIFIIINKIHYLTKSNKMIIKYINKTKQIFIGVSK